MTAEIALLNKSAVVLAADSAVTIGRGKGAKIYNTVNKIFEISDVSPVGLMIFNRLDFMDLPLETIAKEYRRSRGDQDFSTIRDYSNDFLNFLSVDITIGDEDKNLNHSILIFDSLDYIDEKFKRSIRESIKQNKKFLQSKLNGILQEILKTETEILDEITFADGFKSASLDSDLKNLTLEIANSVFYITDITNKTQDLIYKYIAKSLSKSRLSSNRTGLIFAGFGRDEMCPSLAHVEIDGIVRNKLKKVDVNYVNIGRHGPSAEILGFAQDDMVQSFVNGVDPVFRAYATELMRSALEDSAKMILKPFVNDDDGISQITNHLHQEFDSLTHIYTKKADKFIEKKFTEDIKSMVRSMPKQELANLAESLIDITSLKRKVTRDRETVGGDVDVAVISRGEGLVWVKRKHYFPADLNARFFERQSGNGRKQ